MAVTERSCSRAPAPVAPSEVHADLAIAPRLLAESATVMAIGKSGLNNT